MGLFDFLKKKKPAPEPEIKLSAFQAQQVQSMLIQSQDCARLVDSTVKPDVFFERLHFLLDLNLELQKYEKYKFFKGNLPSDIYQQTISNLGEIVDNFITRAYARQQEKVSKLKTEKGKQKSMLKFIDELKTAFDNADSFWTGHPNQSHYEGSLFTNENYERIIALRGQWA